MFKIINWTKQLILAARPQAHPRPSCSLSNSLRLLVWGFVFNLRPHKLSWQAFRPLTLGLFLTFLFLTIDSCGLDIEDPTPPSPPHWVEKSLPEEWPEHGIDAHEAVGIFLEWEPNVNEDIFAYNIYRAAWYELHDSLGKYELVSNIHTESSPPLEYYDRQAQLYLTYYYTLNAEDAENNISAFSDTIEYSLLPKLNLNSMTPNGITDTLGEQRKLTWVYPYNHGMVNYCLTILTEQNDLVIRTVFQPGNFIGDYEDWQIPPEIQLSSGNIYKWRIDTGAKYVDGIETAASESHWATFLFVEN